MKLYVTPTSPYGRLAIIAMHDKGLSERIKLVWTQTRQLDDPLLSVNPSGRLPFLLLGDGTGMEDTDLIVDYFDALAPPRTYGIPNGEEHWPFRRFEATARSLLDGGSVWAREISASSSEIYARRASNDIISRFMGFCFFFRGSKSSISIFSLLEVDITATVPELIHLVQRSRMGSSSIV